MNTFKSFLLLSALTLSSAAFAAEDCIIDPSLMQTETWAEPIFTTPAAVDSRAPASVAEKVEVVPAKTEKNPDQYLEVLAVIPHSEPSLTQAWVEWTVQHGR